MARYPIQGQFKDGNGRTVSSGTVTVYLADSSTTATCYAAASGGSALTGGATTTNTAGYFIVYIDEADYAGSQLFDVTMTKTGFDSQTYADLKPVLREHRNIIDAEEYASFAAAVTAIGSDVKTLVVSTNLTVSTAVTVPSTLHVVVEGAGGFTKSGSGTITFNGPFSAPLKQVFSGFGSGDIVFGRGSVQVDYCEWWGGKGDLSTDNLNPINYALAAFQGSTTVAIGGGITGSEEGSGGTTQLLRGRYLVSDVITIPNSTFLRGVSRIATEIIPTTASKYVVKLLGSHGGLKDLAVYNRSSLATISGVGIVPSDETQTSTYGEANYNSIENIYIVGCANGLVLKAGPYVVASGASNCFYNYFAHVTINGCTRGIWFKDGPNASSSGPNRNTFVGVRIGQSGTNVGIHMESGTTNTFVGTSFEGISTGVSPVASPTAIYIPSATGATSGTALADNKFYGNEYEACTVNENIISGTLTKLFGNDTTTLELLKLTGSEGLILLNDSENSSRFSAIASNAGTSTTYNGLGLTANQKADGSQGNTGLPSWRVDIGGVDNATYSGTHDTITFLRRPAAGSFSNIAQVTANGITVNGSVIANGSTAIPAGGTAGAGLRISSTSNFGIFFGSGVPTLAAAKGSLYLRSDGSSTSTRLYVNTDGSTTWTNVTTAA